MTSTDHHHPSSVSSADVQLAPLPAVLPGGYGRGSYAMGRQTPRIVSGKGAHVVDETGRRRIDANNNFAVLVLGHADATVNRAIEATLSHGTCYGLANSHEPALAEMLVDRIAHAEQIRFANSGSEAVMSAIRAARSATGRSTVVGVRGSYHGSSDAALVIRYGDGAPGTAGAATTVRTVGINRVDELVEMVDRVGDDLAAVIIDLLPNYAGLIQISDEFAQAARGLCDRTGAYLIFDEIISFRSEVGGLQARYPVSPDLTTLGKAIGGGLPIGAVAGSRAAMDPLSPFGRRAVESSGTFTGNPVSSAAGAACLQLFDAHQIARVNELGSRLRASLKRDLDGSWTVRGTGSLARVLPVNADPQWTRQLWWEAWERGTLVMPTGLIALSTPMDEQLVDEIAISLAEAAEKVVANLGSLQPEPESEFGPCSPGS